MNLKWRLVLGAIWSLMLYWLILFGWLESGEKKTSSVPTELELYMHDLLGGLWDPSGVMFLCPCPCLFDWRKWSGVGVRMVVIAAANTLQYGSWPINLVFRSLGSSCADWTDWTIRIMVLSPHVMMISQKRFVVFHLWFLIDFVRFS